MSLRGFTGYFIFSKSYGSCWSVSRLESFQGGPGGQEVVELPQELPIHLETFENILGCSSWLLLAPPGSSWLRLAFPGPPSLPWLLLALSELGGDRRSQDRPEGAIGDSQGFPRAPRSHLGFPGASLGVPGSFWLLLASSRLDILGH